MVLTVISVIFEKNILELADKNGNRYYFKGKPSQKLEKDFESGDVVIF